MIVTHGKFKTWLSYQAFKDLCYLNFVACTKLTFILICIFWWHSVIETLHVRPQKGLKYLFSNFLPPFRVLPCCHKIQAITLSRPYGSYILFFTFKVGIHYVLCISNRKLELVPYWDLNSSYIFTLLEAKKGLLNYA